MSYHFQIKPVGEIDQGFALSCEGVFARQVHHRRLIEAVMHAVQVGSRLSGDIQVFDCEGEVAEVLPLRFEESAEILPFPVLSQAA